MLGIKEIYKICTDPIEINSRKAYNSRGDIIGRKIDICGEDGKGLATGFDFFDAISGMNAVWITIRNFSNKLTGDNKKSRYFFNSGNDALAQVIRGEKDFPFNFEKLTQNSHPIVSEFIEWGGSYGNLRRVDIYTEMTPISLKFVPQVDAIGLSFFEARSRGHEFRKDHYSGFLRGYVCGVSSEEEIPISQVIPMRACS